LGGFWGVLFQITWHQLTERGNNLIYYFSTLSKTFHHCTSSNSQQLLKNPWRIRN